MKKSNKKHLFNPLFRDVDIRVPPSPAGPSEPSEPGQEPQAEPAPLSEDARAFLEAMDGVEPLPEREKTRRSAPGTPAPVHPAPDERREALEHLNGLVRGSVEMDIRFTDEYMEGAVKGVGQKVMRRLRQGRFPIQDHMDLHGLTRAEAKERVREFLLNSHSLGRRCVLIIHGRGLNSPSSSPVLKEHLPGWFSTGPARKVVLAFASARPYDGGAGAVYVLLRRR